eukprot:1661715-Lingulodinium_polyedra.AAC.1
MDNHSAPSAVDRNQSVNQSINQSIMVWTPIEEKWHASTIVFNVANKGAVLITDADKNHMSVVLETIFTIQ